jgi:hypothetical protein
MSALHSKCVWSRRHLFGRTREHAAFIGAWKSMDSPINVSSSNIAALQSLDSCVRLRQQTGGTSARYMASLQDESQALQLDIVCHHLEYMLGWCS